MLVQTLISIYRGAQERGTTLGVHRHVQNMVEALSWFVVLRARKCTLNSKCPKKEL